MTATSPDKTIVLDELIDLDAVQVIFKGAVGGLNVERGPADAIAEQINSAHRPLRAYPREKVPERLHYSHNERIPDIILVPDLGWTLKKETRPDGSGDHYDRGEHGYDNIEPDMSGILIVYGPAFRGGGQVVPPVENIHVYNLLCAILGIVPSPNNGDDRLVEALTVPET